MVRNSVVLMSGLFTALAMLNVGNDGEGQENDGEIVEIV